MFRFPKTVLAAIALCITAVVWVISLMPISQPVPGGDELHHLLAYAGLMIVWRAAVPHPRIAAQLTLAAALAVMGVAIEFAQALTPYRLFEWADMVANTLGVVVGWAIFNGSAALWGAARR